ncbi:DUF4838 domain-containing protein [Roseimicrobium sp. ORNL1]|uniref:DUF4838 domain-containing protein n=1 Tax=Roseimicrobium sp. ORNL1 TaxID=2711231 RepID=UPI0013E1E29A|nr:DUF4838 domain-containing protein [Roseimicrobium sp. ORNL1]QIF01041.1 DUF4838 domain-containing protein [Roseimicrobium sp. ORNL1]
MTLLHRFLLAVSVVALGIGRTHAADFVLASRSIAPAPIVVPKDAPPRTKQAAEELARCLEKMSGAKPQVLEGTPAEMPARAIWVGYQPAVKSAFPQVDFEFKHPEEILIVANDKHVVIAGRDRWIPGGRTVKDRNRKTFDVQHESGTANAVYTFLQGQLGVRWFWPGELGEDVVKSEEIKIAPMEYRYHPSIVGRSGVFHYSNQSDVGYGRSQDWTLHQRLMLDSFPMEGGHGFGDWWERYHETHPEIFALQPDGTRSGFPNPRTVKLCSSNPKVWELWLKQVEEELAKDPGQTLFNASPNDGWSSGHCVCKECSAWDHPDGEPRVFNWYKQNAQRPALSDRDVTFANTLAGLLEQKYPGKGYQVMMLSYGHSRPAPIAARPAKNVVIASVANFLGRTGLVDRGSTRGDTYRQQWDAWTKVTSELLWRPNTGSPAGWQQGLPDLSTQQTASDLKAVAAAGCKGIYIDGVWEHWATMGPQYYVMGQLVWNPSLDTAAVLEDYYRRAFGPAASHVRAYYEGIEKARMAFTAENLEAGVFDFPKLYTPELLRDSQTNLDAAKEAAKSSSEVYQRRVEFVQAGLTYTALILDNIRLMDGYWKKKDPAVAAKVLENWKEVERVIAEHPPAINAGPVRPITPRMVGLHPEYPDRAKKKKTAKKAVDDLDAN